MPVFQNLLKEINASVQKRVSTAGLRQLSLERSARKAGLLWHMGNGSRETSHLPDC